VLVRRGQAVLLIALVIALAVLTLAVVYRVFAMTPAYVYQRSIYYVFKYNPTLVAQGLVLDMNTALLGFARNFSQYMVYDGFNLYLYSIAGVTPVYMSLTELLKEVYGMIVNTVYTPTGLAIPTSPSNVQFSYTTNYYGALGTGLRYIYSGGYSSAIFINVTGSYNMPTLGVYNLTLNSVFNLTVSLVKPSTATCTGSLNPITYTATYRCLFNFTSNTYTCTGPGFSKTGVANNPWAPQYGSSLSYIPSTGWVAGSGVNTLMLVYPIDELNGPSGFKISALFRVNSSKFLIGLNFLAQYPSSSVLSTTGYTYYVTPSGVYFNSNNVYGKGKSPAVGDLENLTVYIVPNAPYGVFSSTPTATLYLYLNGSQVYSTTINLPAWHYVYSSAFNNYAYIFSGQSNLNPSVMLGSWVVVLLSNAVLNAASFKLYSTYQLPTSVYMAVSLNNAPAVGSGLSLSIVKPGGGVTVVKPGYLGFNYTVCNITSNAVIFSVTMPNLNNLTSQLRGYPYYQYLLNVSYNGVNLLLNPWAAGSLKYYGLWSINNIPGGYSATSMGPYWLIIYNTTSNTLLYVFPLWNGGSPTLLEIYQGFYVTAYISGIAYYYTGPVKLPGFLNVMGQLYANYTAYTYSVLLTHEPTGYVMVSEVTRLPPSAPNPVTYTNYIWEFQHFPNQTLPYVYFSYTIMDCTGIGQYSGVSYSNYALIFITPSNTQNGVLLTYYNKGSGGQPC